MVGSGQVWSFPQCRVLSRWSDGQLTARLAPASWSFPLALQFPFIPLTSVWCFIFCCNVYKAFLYIFSSKTNVKNAPPYLHCWTSVHVDASVSQERECVCQAHALLCDCARLLSSHILTCQLARVREPSSLLRRPCASTLSPGRHLLDVDAVTGRRRALEHRRA